MALAKEVRRRTETDADSCSRGSGDEHRHRPGRLRRGRSATAIGRAHPDRRTHVRGDPDPRAASTSEIALVTDVRVGTHAANDRVVFDFAGPGVPALDLTRVAPPEMDSKGPPG